MAKKFFRRADVVGEPLEIQGPQYQVTAVMTDRPPNTHLMFNALLSYSTLAQINTYEETAWSGNNEYTYL
jgi:putative ABC transport system permease protein